MTISLQDLGKRFNREWIFRHLHHEFTSGKQYAITGPNGSGKSTLLQIIGGATTFSEGNVEYFSNSEKYSSEKFYSFVSFSAPYLELVEEMTLREFLNFHSRVKPWLPSVTSTEIISILELEKATDKQIRYFSSGMKQRVKLAQSIFSDVPVVLLDEPCTNLDVEGINLYRKLVNKFTNDRLLIVSSNDRQEYDFCDEVVVITDYKN